MYIKEMTSYFWHNFSNILLLFIAHTFARTSKPPTESTATPASKKKHHFSQQTTERTSSDRERTAVGRVTPRRTVQTESFELLNPKLKCQRSDNHKNTERKTEISSRSFVTRASDRARAVRR